MCSVYVERLLCCASGYLQVPAIESQCYVTGASSLNGSTDKVSQWLLCACARGRTEPIGRSSALIDSHCRTLASVYSRCIVGVVVWLGQREAVTRLLLIQSSSGIGMPALWLFYHEDYF